MFDWGNAIPKEAQSEAADAFLAREKRLLTNNRELATTMSRLRAACLEEIHGLIGEQKLAQYLARQNEMRKRMAEVPLRFPPTPQGRKEWQAFRTEQLAQARAYVKELGIDPRKVQRSYVGKAQSAIAKAFASVEEAPYVEVNEANVPKLTHNPWTWRYPAYDGEWGWHWSNGDGSGRWSSHAASRWSGEIDCWDGIWIDDADDSDWAAADALAEIWVWYRMPAAGMVEAWVWLQDIDTPYDGCVWDEWGWSDASVQQLSRAYLEVFSPQGGRRYQTLLDYRRGDEEGCWSGVQAYPGNFRYAHLFSMESHPAGQWVLMAIGVHDYDYFWVNDMTSHQHLTARWVVNHLAIRSTGAP